MGWGVRGRGARDVESDVWMDDLVHLHRLRVIAYDDGICSAFRVADASSGILLGVAARDCGRGSRQYRPRGGSQRTRRLPLGAPVQESRERAATEHAR